MKGKQYEKQAFNNTEYEPQTVIIKLYPEFRGAVSKKNINIPGYDKILKELKVESIEQMFQGSKPPIQKKSRTGQDLVDISSIYIIKYSSAIPLEEALNKINNMPGIEYAEPLFHHKILSSMEVNAAQYIPNDPTAQPGQQQFYLQRIKAYEAWNITKGDSNITIGIVDTGINFDHEDLKDQVAYNQGEMGLDSFGNDKRSNNIDDDGDGFVDNWRGWNFGNGNNNPTIGNHHGMEVTGISSARTDNAIGIAGTGFRTKFLPVKVSPDGTSNILQGYTGLHYAALMGCKVINLSWGVPNSYSQSAQDLINFVVINLDAVVVAAAGNDNMDRRYFPASYDNVISVGGLQTANVDGNIIDVKWNNSTYNYDVDISVQATSLVSTISNSTTFLNDTYVYTGNGTSMAAPLVAGAAALVRAKFPELNAVQVTEHMRVTGDIIDTLPQNIAYRGKIGRKLNMYRAVTDSVSPAIRGKSIKAFSKYSLNVFNEDTAYVTAKFINYLKPTKNLKITLKALSPEIKMLDSVITVPVINTFESFDINKDQLFKFYVKPNIDDSSRSIAFMLTYEDEGYLDHQYFEVNINSTEQNQNFIDIFNSKIQNSITSNGRIGFEDYITKKGSGFKFKSQNLLYESGLMIGAKTEEVVKVSNCVRTIVDIETADDFEAINPVKYDLNTAGDMGTASKMKERDDIAKIGIVITQKSYTWSSMESNSFVIHEYNIKNISGQDLDSLHVGLFTDWDIMDYTKNRADYDTETEMGYVFSNQANSIFAGTILLTPQSPSCYSLDGYNSGGNNINPNKVAGFSRLEKYHTLSNGIGRPQAGVIGGGNDVLQVFGSTVTDLKANDSVTVAFAMLAADNLDHLKNTAQAAREKFKTIKTGKIPSHPNLAYCNEVADIVIAPTEGSRFNFYETYPGTPVSSGSTFERNNVSENMTLYITNIDSIFESQAFTLPISFSTVNVDFEITPDTLVLDYSNEAIFLDQSDNGLSLKWFFGNEEIDNQDEITRIYNTTGTFPVKLVGMNGSGCKDSVTKNIIVQNITSLTPGRQTASYQVYPNPTQEQLVIQFSETTVKDITIMLTDAIGQELVRKENLSPKREIQLNLSSLPAGIYFLKVISGEDISQTKIIKN